MISTWSDSTNLPTFDSLTQDIQTDVLIIGGGIAGILCAYMLEQENVNYALVEANRICSGVTKNTTAKITSQHGLIYHKLIQRFGVENARLYLEANESAIRKYQELTQLTDCSFEQKNAFVYALKNEKKIEQELEALHKIGYRAEFAKNLPLPFEVSGAVKFTNQAQFNPLQLLAHIAKPLRIYEHTKVQELAHHTALTPHGKITASKIIVATHFPFLNKHGSYFLKMYQSRSYVLALENAQAVNGMYIDENDKGLSFRNHKNLLLLGGGSHRTGKDGGNWKELSSFAQKYYPNSTVRYKWATQDCMTLDEMPDIGPYSKNTDDLYVATGFHKWGMTSAMVSALLLRDLILEKKNPYQELFSPSRTILRPQLLVNAFETTTNFLIPTTKRCPHLGCALKWNPCERSWDCPCHGSRFTEQGKLIDNPATDDLTVSSKEVQ